MVQFASTSHQFDQLLKSNQFDVGSVILRNKKNITLLVGHFSKRKAPTTNSGLSRVSRLKYSLSYPHLNIMHDVRTLLKF